MKNGVPPERVLPICAETGWRVTPHEVRPDIYPNPTDALPQPKADEPPWHLYGGY